ncbi:Beta-galactosidase [Melipona quadrifasciata]|uniref:Beta-galactosidase n=1 Tax=Melipona quadrifasciata TaxID=166423 RepID=A0A0N0BHA4_9HYME|nr:Beta-galactosidase [Melipona quadrifasciata]
MQLILKVGLIQSPGSTRYVKLDLAIVENFKILHRERANSSPREEEDKDKKKTRCYRNDWIDEIDRARYPDRRLSFFEKPAPTVDSRIVGRMQLAGRFATCLVPRAIDEVSGASVQDVDGFADLGSDHQCSGRSGGRSCKQCEYVEWSLHQPSENEWHWTGNADLMEFLNIAQEEDLFVLLRPGPYICAERDFGGLPYWLLSRVPDIRLRSSDPRKDFPRFLPARYTKYVKVYLNELLKLVWPYLRGNGGPVIMIQVENEYGSYGCDTQYTSWLRDTIKQKIGSKALLYTTDGSAANLLHCGFVPEVYATIDFGTNTNVTKNFEIMRLYQPRGPLVNSEFYPGWLSHWQEPFQRVQTAAVAKTLDDMLFLGASVNIYMFHGGTNFAYTAGANGDEGTYSPQLTSYDYDAPLTEAGDPTPKYFEIRNVVSKYLPLPNVSVPTASPKGDYGPVVLTPIVGLFEPRGRQLFETVVVEGSKPLTFEELNLPHWLVLYETDLVTPSYSDPANLHAMVRDRALVYVDDHLIGTLSRSHSIYDVSIENPYGRKLKLLVENQGRLNYGSGLRDYKGLTEVFLNNARLPGPWKMTGFRLDYVDPFLSGSALSANGTLYDGPVVLRGDFVISGQPMDTYLNTVGWGKGVAFVNGRNLGRYWPLAGPQMTLYVPAPYLRTGQNQLVLVELEYVPTPREIKLQNEPILDYKARYSNSGDNSVHLDVMMQSTGLAESAIANRTSHRPVTTVRISVGPQITRGRKGTTAFVAFVRLFLQIILYHQQIKYQ